MIKKVPAHLIDVKLFLTQEEAVLFYEHFLETLQNKVYGNTIQLEKHHFIPMHAGGSNTLDNIIKISPEDHVAIHFYRYQAYKQLGDKVAFEMRINDTNERAYLRSQAAIAANKSKKQLFWSCDWQSLQGKKGGVKGGSAKTPAQFAARQKIGLAFGEIVGLSNQSKHLKFVLLHDLEWEFLPDKSTYFTNTCKTTAGVIAQLEKLKPDKIRNTKSFYKVFHGKRRQLYGWRLKNMVIRSEADAG